MFQNLKAISLAPLIVISISSAIGADAMTTRTKQTTATKKLNPIRPIESADPAIIREDNKWYVYHTGSYAGGHYPIGIVSDDLTSWSQIGHIFPAGNEPGWTSHSWWAPEVHRVNGKYIAYYTVRQKENNRFAIGAAIADSPAGPFKDVGKPIVRNEEVGLIDVNYFQDPNTGRKYLLWKEDQNDFDPPRPTPILIQQLEDDGLTVIGESIEILRNDRPWEGVLVEAPQLIYRDGWYYLFYSGNIYAIDEYAVGIARSRDIWGPYEKYPDPILVHDEHFSGPGHQFVIQDEDGKWHMFYHARVKASEGDNRRYLMHDFINWGKNGWPTINDKHPSPLDHDMLDEIKERRQVVLERRKAKMLPED